MASCSEKCFIYNKDFDELGEAWNDIGPEDSHFCAMYYDRIPDGIFDGPKKCPFFEDKARFEKGNGGD